MSPVKFTIGKINNTTYITTYKIGSEAIRKKCDSSYIKIWDGKENLVTENAIILIRNPIERFYSGLTQACVHDYQRGMYQLEHIEVPPKDMSAGYFIFILNNYWNLIKNDSHLSPYLDTVFKLLTLFNNYEIADINNVNLSKEFSHSNSGYYSSIIQALESGKIKPKVKLEIEEFLNRESKYYSLLSQN